MTDFAGFIKCENIEIKWPLGKKAVDWKEHHA